MKSITLHALSNFHLMLPAFMGLLLSFLPLSSIASSGDSTTTGSDLSCSADDPWAFMLDSVLHMQSFEYDRFTCDSAVLHSMNMSGAEAPRYDDSVYIKAFRSLHASSPMEYRFNSDVRSNIELYTVRRRQHLARVMALSQVYFPLIEEYLDKYDLPIELKYLAVIESALNPVAISRAGAGGLWQFMPATGRIYGLNSNSYYDERSDPHLATEAACKHLRALYEIYGDWLLAIAAYNSGSGNVNKAIRLSGGSSFWEISRYLPRETRGYVPAFVAVSFVMQHPEMYAIQPMVPAWKAYEIDTLQVNFPVSFKVLSDSLGIPVADLCLLNPAYTRAYIPGSPEEPRILSLPVNQVGLFIQNEQMLRNFAISGRMEQVYGSRCYSGGRTQAVHVVRKGESLGVIAAKYGTSVSTIKSLNHLKSNTIHPGQRLTVSRALPSVQEATMTGEQRNVFELAYDYHIARDGETLESIALQYDNILVTDLAELNSIPTDRKLEAGSKVRLRPKAS